MVDHLLTDTNQMFWPHSFPWLHLLYANTNCFTTVSLVRRAVPQGQSSPLTFSALAALGPLQKIIISW